MDVAPGTAAGQRVNRPAGITQTALPTITMTCECGWSRTYPDTVTGHRLDKDAHDHWAVCPGVPRTVNETL